MTAEDPPQPDAPHEAANGARVITPANSSTGGRDTGLGASSPEKATPDLMDGFQNDGHIPITIETRTKSPQKDNTRPSSNAGPPLTPNVAQIPRIPSPPPEVVREVKKMSKARKSALSRYPPQMIRMSTVPVSNKTKTDTFTMPSVYYESPLKREKTITWQEATESRPPLRIDMDGPTPSSYSPRNKPLNETNAPAYTFGSKCWPEKSTTDGSRTSWSKTWIQHPFVFNHKTDFFSDRKWPSPATYRIKPLLGPRQSSSLEYPSFTIGERRSTQDGGRVGSENQPAPWEYDKQRADHLVMNTGSSFSMTPRRGKSIFPHKDKTPGPGTYSPKYTQNFKSAPSFTVCGIRKEKSTVLGPFSAQ